MDAILQHLVMSVTVVIVHHVVIQIQQIMLQVERVMIMKNSQMNNAQLQLQFLALTM